MKMNEKQSLSHFVTAPFTQGSRLARIPDKAEILISAKRNANQRTERKGKNTHKPLQEKPTLTKGKDAENEADINKSLSIINFLLSFLFLKEMTSGVCERGAIAPFARTQWKMRTEVPAA